MGVTCLEFRGENFRRRLKNREIRESFLPRKFPAIRYSWNFWPCTLYYSAVGIKRDMKMLSIFTYDNSRKVAHRQETYKCTTPCEYRKNIDKMDPKAGLTPCSDHAMIHRCSSLVPRPLPRFQCRDIAGSVQSRIQVKKCHYAVANCGTLHITVCHT